MADQTWDPMLRFTHRVVLLQQFCGEERNWLALEGECEHKQKFSHECADRCVLCVQF